MLLLKKLLVPIITLIVCNPVLTNAREEIKFGDPVQAAVSEIDEHLLHLSSQKPPKQLAHNAEVIVVSGYEPAERSNYDTTVNITLDRPGKKVLLVVSSYEKIRWVVNATPGTMVSAILASGYKAPTVSTAIETRGFITKLPYSYKTEDIRFRRLVTQLSTLFGINKLDAFYGSYQIPTDINISTIDLDNTALTATGPQPKTPPTNFSFDLAGSDNSPVSWTLTGSNQKTTVDPSVKKVIDQANNKIYEINNDGITISDIDTHKKTMVPLPKSFPELSWATSIAYDSERSIVTIASLGGEGFLYRYHANKAKWIDFRSLNNVDIFSIAYDKVMDQYVAWSSDGDLIFISSQGSALFSRKVRNKLNGFGRLYDTGNSRQPTVKIAPHGNDIGLIYINSGQVKNIWLYDVKKDRAMLTY